MASIPLLDILQDQNPWWSQPGARRALRYPVRRDFQLHLRERLGRQDRRAALVMGPRQVGKTIGLLQLADDLLDAGLPPANLTYFDFSDDRLTVSVSAREVEGARPVGFQAEAPRVLLLDELRFAPNWDRWLKQAVDASVGRIVATDSAASILRAGTRESGQGRWDELRIEGLSFTEFARLHAVAEENVEQVLLRRPTLHEHYLRVGGFPEHAFSDAYAEVRQRLRADIAERAIFRDLLPLGVDLQRVKDLFVYLVQDSGSVFEAAVRARDLTPVADVRSVQAWVDLLETTLMLAPLERFGLRATARLRSGRRLYAADHGLIQAFAIAPRRDVRVLAQVAEAVVFRHLRDLAKDSGGELSYYRQDDEREIDFVLSSPTGVIAIEVTSSRRLRSEKLDELRRARAALKPNATVLIFGGVVESREDDIQILPLAGFLRDPRRVLEGVEG